ncbi:hypothetical protein FXN61_00820 [Lentzea sp. PSKA42]|uniref:Secreted protein n=1 Tax=Lentzea indica TaxID=2604800 RepID=A0ABX1F9F6_9PSEU|nr:hypothetical protein [Lentzea indica]NKE55444.1 hypothetical protein [Lentzea indica]
MIEFVLVFGSIVLAGFGAWAWSASRRDGKTSLRARFSVGQAFGSFELTRESEAGAPTHEVSEQAIQQAPVSQNSRAATRKTR